MNLCFYIVNFIIIVEYLCLMSSDNSIQVHIEVLSDPIYKSFWWSAVANQKPASSGTPALPHSPTSTTGIEFTAHHYR